MAAKSKKIKKCPFCGSKPVIRFELDDIGDYLVMCDCGATCGGLVYSKDEAIDRWNRRVNDPINNDDLQKDLFKLFKKYFPSDDSSILTKEVLEVFHGGGGFIKPGVFFKP
jgi:Lar family restriction alleviation protein